MHHTTISRRAILLISLVCLLALIGLVDSFLVYERASGIIALPCVVGNGCDTVVFSPYAKIFGVPMALLGMIFYGALLLVSAITVLVEKRKMALLTSVFVFVGLLFSLYLLYLQVFVIGALCFYCMISLADILIATGLIIWALRRVRVA